MDAAKRAVALDPSDAEAHSVLGSGLVDRGELELAKASQRDAAQNEISKIRRGQNEYQDCCNHNCNCSGIGWRRCCLKHRWDRIQDS
jgi:hypothetical protein